MISNRPPFFAYLFSVGKIDNNRFAWIDYAKGIAIIMIVFRHVNTGLWDAGIELDPFFYDVSTQVGLTFRMPLYFLLSGIFFTKSFQKRGASGYVHHKLITIIYPYFVWGVILMSLQIIFSDYVNGKFNSVYDFFDLFYDPWGHLWFLYVLFVVSVLYMVLKIAFRSAPDWIVLAICIFLYFLSYGIGNIYLLDDTLKLLVFFAIGDSLAQAFFKIESYKALFDYRTILTLIILSVCAEYLLFTSLRNDPTTNLVGALVGSVTACLLCVLLSRSQSSIIHDLLRIIGQHSLYIYLLHAFTSAGIRIILHKFLNIHSLLILEVAGSFFGIVGPIILYRIISYFGMSFLFTPSRLVPKTQNS